MNTEEKNKYSTPTLVGFPTFLGIKLEELNDEFAHISLAMKPEYVNPMGIPHGGILATMLDQVAGTLVYHSSGLRRIVTRSADIHYLKVSDDTTLHAYSHIVNRGSRMCLACGEVKDSSGKLLATGSFEYFFT